MGKKKPALVLRTLAIFDSGKILEREIKDVSKRQLEKCSLIFSSFRGQTPVERI